MGTEDTSTALEPMSREEGHRLGQLERQIEKGWRAFERAALEAIVEIRDQRLYRARYLNFDNWCQDFLGMTRKAVDAAIARNRYSLAQSPVEPRKITREHPRSSRANASRPIPTRSTESPKTGDQSPTVLEPDDGPGKTPRPPKPKRDAPEPRQENGSSAERTTDRQLAYRVMTAISNIDAELAGAVFTASEATYLRQWSQRALDSWRSTNGAVQPIDRTEVTPFPKKPVKR